MNCLIANNQVMMIDAMLAPDIFQPAEFQQADFMTEYGLIYPYHNGWPLVRMILDATKLSDLQDKNFLNHYKSPHAMRCAYLDWNARLWDLILFSKNDVTTVHMARIPQHRKPTVVTNVEGDQSAALNAVLKETMSLTQAAKKINQVSTTRMGLPIMIEYEQFKKMRPDGAMNLPAIAN